MIIVSVGCQSKVCPCPEKGVCNCADEGCQCKDKCICGKKCPGKER